MRCTATSSSLLLGQDITIAPLLVPQPWLIKGHWRTEARVVPHTARRWALPSRWASILEDEALARHLAVTWK